jgi:hypothetical protein
MRAQRECIELQARRVVVRAVVAAFPSAMNTVPLDASIAARPGLPRAVEAKAVLDDHASAIHVVGQVVTQRICVGKRRMAERHDDLVLLKLSQGGRAACCNKQVNRDHIRLGQDFRLKLTRLA